MKLIFILFQSERNENINNGSTTMQTDLKSKTPMTLIYTTQSQLNPYQDSTHRTAPISAIQCIYNSNRCKGGGLKFSNYKEEGSRIAIFIFYSSILICCYSNSILDSVCVCSVHCAFRN